MWSISHCRIRVVARVSIYLLSAMSYSLLRSLPLLALLALWPHSGEAQLQLADVDMARAVEVLADRFQSIANDGLGIDALKVSELEREREVLLKCAVVCARAS